MNSEIKSIIGKALDNSKLSQREIVALLDCPDTSEEAFAIRAAAGFGMRERTDNAAVVFGQIGLEMHPCEANCSFCSFAKDYTQLQGIEISDADLIAATENFTGSGELFGLYLMMMASYDLDKFLDKVATVKQQLGGPTNLYSNVGDTSVADFERMKAAGIDGVYHCWRLREGADTPFDPEARKQTMRNAKEAGLDVLDAVEPIGPEHTSEELAEHILFSIELGSIQSGSMKRIPVPGTPFADKGMITDFRLSQVVAAQALANFGHDRMPWLGIHEPSPLGYMSGANMISAETGVNPRDTAEDTSAGRGMDIAACRDMLRQCGFTKLAKGDGTLIDM